MKMFLLHEIMPQKKSENLEQFGQCFKIEKNPFNRVKIFYICIAFRNPQKNYTSDGEDKQ